MEATDFSTKVKYTISCDVLFLPCTGYKSVISPGEIFLYVHAPKEYGRLRKGVWFKIPGSPTWRIFSIDAKYLDKVIKAK